MAHTAWEGRRLRTLGFRTTVALPSTLHVIGTTGERGSAIYGNDGRGNGIGHVIAQCTNVSTARDV